MCVCVDMKIFFTPFYRYRPQKVSIGQLFLTQKLGKQPAVKVKVMMGFFLPLPPPPAPVHTRCLVRVKSLCGQR